MQYDSEHRRTRSSVFTFGEFGIHLHTSLKDKKKLADMILPLSKTQPTPDFIS